MEKKDENQLHEDLNNSAFSINDADNTTLIKYIAIKVDKLANSTIILEKSTNILEELRRMNKQVEILTKNDAEMMQTQREMINELCKSRQAYENLKNQLHKERQESESIILQNKELIQFQIEKINKLNDEYQTLKIQSDKEIKEKDLEITNKKEEIESQNTKILQINKEFENLQLIKNKENKENQLQIKKLDEDLQKKNEKLENIGIELENLQLLKNKEKVENQLQIKKLEEDLQNKNEKLENIGKELENLQLLKNKENEENQLQIKKLEENLQNKDNLLENNKKEFKDFQLLRNKEKDESQIQIKKIQEDLQSKDKQLEDIKSKFENLDLERKKGSEQQIIEIQALQEEINHRNKEIENLEKFKENLNLQKESETKEKKILLKKFQDEIESKNIIIKNLVENGEMFRIQSQKDCEEKELTIKLKQEEINTQKSHIEKLNKDLEDIQLKGATIAQKNLFGNSLIEENDQKSQSLDKRKTLLLTQEKYKEREIQVSDETFKTDELIKSLNEKIYKMENELNNKHKQIINETLENDKELIINETIKDRETLKQPIEKLKNDFEEEQKIIKNKDTNTDEILMDKDKLVLVLEGKIDNLEQINQELEAKLGLSQTTIATQKIKIDKLLMDLISNEKKSKLENLKNLSPKSDTEKIISELKGKTNDDQKTIQILNNRIENLQIQNLELNENLKLIEKEKDLKFKEIIDLKANLISILQNWASETKGDSPKSLLNIPSPQNRFSINFGTNSEIQNKPLYNDLIDTNENSNRDMSNEIETEKVKYDLINGQENFMILEELKEKIAKTNVKFESANIQNLKDQITNLNNEKNKLKKQLEIVVERYNKEIHVSKNVYQKDLRPQMTPSRRQTFGSKQPSWLDPMKEPNNNNDKQTNKISEEKDCDNKNCSRCPFCHKIEDYDQIKECLIKTQKIRPEVIEQIQNDEKWNLENLDMKKDEILNCLNLGSTSQKLQYICLYGNKCFDSDCGNAYLDLVDKNDSLIGIDLFDLNFPIETKIEIFNLLKSKNKKNINYFIIEKTKLTYSEAKQLADENGFKLNDFDSKYFNWLKNNNKCIKNYAWTIGRHFDCWFFSRE